MSTLIKHNQIDSELVHNMFHFNEIRQKNIPTPNLPFQNRNWEISQTLEEEPTDGAGSPREKQLQMQYELLHQTVEQVNHLQQQWQAESHRHVLELALAISRRIIRGQIEQQPEISLRWIRESLELLSTSRRLRIFLHPADRQSLGASSEQIAGQVAPVAEVEIMVDEGLAPGECRVETEHGLIDQSVDAQLQRIFSELDDSPESPLLSC